MRSSAISAAAASSGNTSRMKKKQQHTASAADRGSPAEAPGADDSADTSATTAASSAASFARRFSSRAARAVGDGPTWQLAPPAVTLEKVFLQVVHAHAGVLEPLAGAGHGILLAADLSPSDTAKLLFRWVWGDGTPDASGRNLTQPSHTYRDSGSYKLLLEVTDADVEAFIADEIASAGNQTAAARKHFESAEGKEEARFQVQHRRTLDWLVGQATVQVSGTRPLRDAGRKAEAELAETAGDAHDHHDHDHHDHDHDHSQCDHEH